MSEFWLSDEQFERLRPLLPNKVRGVARVDDRRVISGIIHVVKSGGRWVEAPAGYGRGRRSTTAPCAGREGHLAGVVRDPCGSRQTAGRGSDRQHAQEGAPLGGRRKRGALLQAIGVSRGDRTSKLHALIDGEGRPLRFLLTPGNAADARAALQLLDALPARAMVLADKA